MLAALLPVKAFARSKQRLAPLLTQQERELLARTMFDDVWETLRSVRTLDRLLVATSEPYVLQRCREQHVQFLEESEQISHSRSVSQASDWAASMGSTTLVSVAIDTPGATPEEFADLIRQASLYQVVIVPSADGTGTNALARTPPAAIQPHFGPGSCAIHAGEAEARGLTHRVCPIPGFAADIDTPEDLEAFLKLHRPSRTTELVRRLLADRRTVIGRVPA